MKEQQDTPDMDGIEPSIYKRRWKILATLCTSLLVVMVANSSLNLALPILATELSLTSLELTWVVDIYVLVFASLLFTASAVADRYGRKLIMQLGLLIFLAGTAYAGFIAETGIEVIIARAVMGIGGAMVMPTTLSIVNTVFPRKERSRAIAIWSGIAGAGIALGSIVSGFLLEHFSWQSVFVFTAALGVVGLVFNQVLTPESSDEDKTPVDWFGGVLSVAALLGIVYGIIEAPSHGILAGDVLAALVVGVLSLVAFVWWQKRVKYPMLDMKLFRSASFSVAAVAVTLAFFALMGVFFSMSQLFQLVMGYGAMESSIRMLPLMMIMIFVSPFVPNIVKMIGTRPTVGFGLVIVSIGFVLMSLWPVIPDYWQVVGAMSVMMFGMSLTMTPATNIMMSSVPRNRSGMGSAMNDTTRELGGAIGIAVLGSMLASVYEEKIADVAGTLPQQLRDVVNDSLAGAILVADRLGPAGDQLAYVAKEAWMNGLSTAMLVAAGIVFTAAVMVFIWLPNTKDIDAGKAH